MALVISPEMFRGKVVRASGWRTPVSQGLANASPVVQVNLLTSTYVTGRACPLIFATSACKSAINCVSCAA